MLRTLSIQILVSSHKGLPPWSYVIAIALTRSSKPYVRMSVKNYASVRLVLLSKAMDFLK